MTKAVFHVLFKCFILLSLKLSESSIFSRPNAYSAWTRTKHFDNSCTLYHRMAPNKPVFSQVQQVVEISGWQLHHWLSLSLLPKYTDAFYSDLILESRNWGRTDHFSMTPCINNQLVGLTVEFPFSRSSVRYRSNAWQRTYFWTYITYSSNYNYPSRRC